MNRHPNMGLFLTLLMIAIFFVGVIVGLTINSNRVIKSTTITDPTPQIILINEQQIPIEYIEPKPKVNK